MNEDRFRFRAWINELGCFADGVDVYHDGSFNMWLDFDCGKNMIQPDDSDTLMQSTGLRDKNKKLVFGDDIVRFKYMNRLNVVVDLIGVFVYCDDELRWEIDIYGDDSYTCLSYVSNGIMSDFEVIGNIYENPELLKPAE